MKTTIKLWYEEKYLPNKRCRKLRERAVSKDVDIEVCEVTKEEFPVAFVIHDYESVYEGAKSYSEWTLYKKENIPISQEYRTKMMVKESILEPILQGMIDELAGK